MKRAKSSHWWLSRMQRRCSTLSARSRLQRMPGPSSRTRTRLRMAPSMTPVAMGRSSRRRSVPLLDLGKSSHFTMIVPQQSAEPLSALHRVRRVEICRRRTGDESIIEAPWRFTVDACDYRNSHYVTLEPATTTSRIHAPARHESGPKASWARGALRANNATHATAKPASSRTHCIRVRSTDAVEPRRSCNDAKPSSSGHQDPSAHDGRRLPLLHAGSKPVTSKPAL
jgi:hypothetical protein